MEESSAIDLTKKIIGLNWQRFGFPVTAGPAAGQSLIGDTQGDQSALRLLLQQILFQSMLDNSDLNQIKISNPRKRSIVEVNDSTPVSATASPSALPCSSLAVCPCPAKREKGPEALDLSFKNQNQVGEDESTTSDSGHQSGIEEGKRLSLECSISNR